MNIKLVACILALSLGFSTANAAKHTANSNEKAFIEYGDACAHLTREIIGQSPERAASLRRGIVQTCPQAIKLYKKVLKQPVQHPSTHQTFLVMNGIGEPELTDKQKKLFCSTLSKENYEWLCK